MVVSDLVGQGESQIYLTCGKSNHGTLRQLTHGLSVIEMATSPMPLKPVRVLTIKATTSDSLDKYLIVSFEQTSLILGINEGKISSVTDSGFCKDEPTLHAGVLADGSFVQVTRSQIVHVRQHLKQANQSLQQDKRLIRAACSNAKQVIIQVEEDQLICFELDSQQGGLVQKGQKLFKDKEARIRAIDVGPVPEGR